MAKSNEQVSVCEPSVQPCEPLAPEVMPSTPGETCMSGETSRGGTAAEDREKNKEQGETDGALQDQRQTDVPAHHLESGETVPTIESKRQEFKNTEEEKRDRSKEEPCEKSLEKKERGQSDTLK